MGYAIGYWVIFPIGAAGLVVWLMERQRKAKTHQPLPSVARQVLNIVVFLGVAAALITYLAIRR